MYRRLKTKLFESNRQSISTYFIIAILVFLMGTLEGHAQNNTVTGLVVDKNNEPLLGVSVIVKGTKRAGISDFDGMYSIQAKKGDVLQFSFMGYSKSDVKVYNNNTINVTLDYDIS